VCKGCITVIQFKGVAFGESIARLIVTRIPSIYCT